MIICAPKYLFVIDLITFAQNDVYSAVQICIVWESDLNSPSSCLNLEVFIWTQASETMTVTCSSVALSANKAAFFQETHKSVGDAGTTDTSWHNCWNRWVWCVLGIPGSTVITPQDRVSSKLLSTTRRCTNHTRLTESMFSKRVVCWKIFWLQGSQVKLPWLDQRYGQLSDCPFLPVGGNWTCWWLYDTPVTGHLTSDEGRGH